MARTTPRLIDIAKRAELSVTSISRILSGQRLSEYSPDTQTRVRKIAEELGWRPNLVVQGMKTGQTHTFGVFMAPYDTFWTGVLYGVHDTLLEAKQVPVVLWPHAQVHPTIESLRGHDWARGEGPVAKRSQRPDGASPPADQPTDEAGSVRRELERINCLEDRRVDAIISWPLYEQNARERLTMLSARGLPVVTIDDALPAPAKSIHVGHDEVGTMASVRGHLDELGHRQVVYIGLGNDHTWAKQRKSAFLKTWPEFDADATFDLDIVDGEHRHGEINTFLQSHPKATAIVTATDHVARQVTRALSLVGKRVPEDFSVVGFGNDAFNKGDIPLTTIDQRPYEVGQIAAQLTLQTPKPRKRSVHVPTQLLVQESTRPLTT
ncbi:MAG: LacI family DNA-binding transcriptional regulator [Planctomycetota bacterium]